MAYEALIERIKKLSEPTIEQMSPEVMARLTHFFEEPLVRQLLYTVTTNFEQRKVIRYIMKAYQSWKKNTNASYIPAGLLPRVYEYPEYMNDLQMDIECGMVITEKGTFSENTTTLKVSLIPKGATPLKAVRNESQPALPTNEEKTAGSNQSGITDKSDIEKKNKQLAELQQEIEEMEKRVDPAPFEARIKELDSEIEQMKKITVIQQNSEDQDRIRTELDEARNTIKSLQEEVEHWKDELAAYKERQQNRAGINRLQTAHFGLKVAPMLGINVTNKKDLAPMLSKLFGWGQRSMEQQLCKYIHPDDEMEVAKIFGDLSPELAVKFCSDFQGTPKEDAEAPPTD